jgi:hypothetical protein
MNFFSVIGLFILGLLSISLVSFFTSRELKRQLESSDDIPVSVNILRASHLVSLALLVEKISLPFSELSNILLNSLQGWDFLLKLGTYLSLFFAIILIVHITLSWFSSISYSLMTKGRRPVEDANKGRLSNTILFVGIQISLTIAVKSTIPELLEILIPYPNLPIFH